MKNMGEQYIKGIMTSTKTVLTITGVFLSSFLLLKCQNKDTENDPPTLFYYQIPRSHDLLSNREPETFVEFSGDTVFIKTNIPPTGDNVLRFEVMTSKSQKKLRTLLERLDLNRIQTESPTIGHYSYEYGIRINGESVRISSDSLPYELDSLRTFIQGYLDRLEELESVNLNESYLAHVSFTHIENEKGKKVKLSPFDAYSLWKAMLFSNQKRVNQQAEDGKYQVTIQYPPSYTGTKPSQMSSNDLREFSYSIDKRTYCFEVYPLSIELTGQFDVASSTTE